MVKELGDEDQRRVEERKKRLGKKGLKDLKRIVESAVEENDGVEVPEAVYKSLTVPSLASVEMRKIEQFYTYAGVAGVESGGESPLEGFVQGQLENLRHLQMQVDHLEGNDEGRNFSSWGEIIWFGQGTNGNFDHSEPS